MDKPHIYKITNNINNKYYYGVHKGNNTEKYMGSGVALKRAQEKHGLENFSKEILLWFDTEEEAYEYEAVIVNQEMVDNPMCYNLVIGGMLNGSLPGRNISTYTRKAMSKGQKKWWKENEHRKDEIYKKIADKNRGRKNSDEALLNLKKAAKLRGAHSADVYEKIAESNRGQKRSDEFKKKQSDAALKQENNILTKRVKCPVCGYESNVAWVKRKCGLNGEKHKP